MRKLTATLCLTIALLFGCTGVNPQNIKSSAEQGDASAQAELGRLYLNGMKGVPKDYKTALKWYRLAAKQGHATAQYARTQQEQEKVSYRIMSVPICGGI